MRKRLQNKVAESRFAFPVTIAYAILVWMANDMANKSLYVQFALFVVSALMMLLLNNMNALIRIYSRMVSCTFIVMTCASTFIFSSLNVAVVQSLFILFYLSLLRSYQDKHATGIVFYSFLCLGMASLFFVQILFYIPFLWILMATNIMAISHKMFWSSILGLATPYWFMGAYSFYAGTTDSLINNLCQIIEFQPLFEYESLGINRILTFAFIALLSLIGIVHFLRNSYLDKIRTRMIFEIFITIDILTIMFIVLQPQHFDTLLPIITINTSCLYAHYIALTKTRITNIVCIINFIMAIALTIFNTLS